ncbi:MAG: DUF1573 domain-containing protein [Tidjanibacter sp.]|nr:DUF1573 domain-containing protein [Tidjanibacter sp.]
MMTCGVRNMLMGVVAFGAVVALPAQGRAQIKIIPQATLQEAATPTHTAQVGIEIEAGGVVQLGVLNESDQPKHLTVRWLNRSGRKAAITHIRSGCGCLVANHDTKPIGSGESGTIGLVFNPKGRSGNVNHKVYLYTTLSDEAPSAVIEVVGEVKSGEGTNPLWPHSIGVLRMRTGSVAIGSDERTVRIAVRNEGSTPLVVRHDRRLSSQGIAAHTEPKVLAPSQEGDLVVELSPTADTSKPLMFYLEGVDAPPRERKIELIVK